MVADLDGNGTSDVATANFYGDDVSVLLNRTPVLPTPALGDPERLIVALALLALAGALLHRTRIHA